jgi:glycosyltransferase involved in cell wall biosynthesis
LRRDVRILLISKFPPIEGGVSAHTFWLVRSLAREGHSVRVVTNASEVEPTFAQLHYGQDLAWMEGVVGRGQFFVHQTTPVESLSFIPFAQPYLTKLFGLSLSVVREYACDMILSWYFEPYGVVAALIGKTIGRPFVMRHAGSDLGRLARHPQLAAAYRWALEGAAGLVVTNERELETRFGPINRPRLRLARPRLPDVFSSSHERLDVRELLAASLQWFSNIGLSENLIQDIGRINAKPLAGNVFTVGVYGKVGVTKGSFDLIEALAEVSRTRAEFAFLTVSCGRREVLQRYYQAIVSSAALAERSWILPPIAPWRIPAFLRCCDAVCFLERDFPVPFHGPLIPREVLLLSVF